MRKLVLFLALIVLISLVSADDKTVCNSVYYFILDNNYNYTNEDLMNLEEELNITNISDYIIDYYELCYIKDYSDRLPDKPLPKIIIYKNNSIDECDLKTSFPFKTSIPTFFDISVGNISCVSAKKLKYIFNLEENRSYSIKGIRIFWGFFILIFIVVGSFLKSNSYLNRAIKKIFKE